MAIKRQSKYPKPAHSLTTKGRMSGPSKKKHQPVCLSVCLIVCLSVSLSVCLHNYSSIQSLWSFQSFFFFCVRLTVVRSVARRMSWTGSSGGGCLPSPRAGFPGSSRWARHPSSGRQRVGRLGALTLAFDRHVQSLVTVDSVRLFCVESYSFLA